MPSNHKVSFLAHTTCPPLAVRDSAPRCSDLGPSLPRRTQVAMEGGWGAPSSASVLQVSASPHISLARASHTATADGQGPGRNHPSNLSEDTSGHGTDDCHALRHWAIFLRPFQVLSVLLQCRLRGVGVRAVFPSSLPSRP